MSKITFQHSDAWIFLCIPKDQPGATKEEIFSDADHINQAIPTNEEFTGAISRGIEAGLIEGNNNKYHYTKKYGKKIQTLIDSEKDILSAWDTLEQFLKNL